MKKLIIFLFLLFSLLSFGQTELFDASPLGIIADNKVVFSKVGTDNEVLRFIADEIKRDKFKDSLGLKGGFSIGEYFENACMPLANETKITIYQIITYSYKDGTRTIIRFIPGDRTGMPFVEAASARMLEVLKSLENTYGAEKVRKQLGPILEKTESMRDNLICGIIAVDRSGNSISFPDIKIQNSLGHLKHVSPFVGNY